MSSKTAMMIVGFFVMMVAALGHEGGPLTQMSEVGGERGVPQPEAVALAASQPQTPKRAQKYRNHQVTNSNGYEVKLENPETFAKQESKGYDWDAFFSENRDPEPRPQRNAPQKRVRSAYFDSNPLPAGKIDYDFDPRLEWSESL